MDCPKPQIKLQKLVHPW